MKLVDLSFYVNYEFNNPLDAIQAEKPVLGYVDCIKQRLQIQAVRHFSRDTRVTVNDVTYTFFEGRNRFWQLPLRTLNYLAAEQPDVVLVQGLDFPFQIIMLRLWLGKKVVLIAQHHAEKPRKGLAKILQQIADRCINAYLFTAKENAHEWFNRKIIHDRSKYHELLGLSTGFTRQKRHEARLKAGIGAEGDVFLWVGGLEARKDPVTVLDGFAKHVAKSPGARLYIVYQQDSLLAEIKTLIAKSGPLENSVHLLAGVEHIELATLFSAADFYLSGSHREDSGMALVEAMACGCIPVVTYIPNFRKITNEGRYGFLYKPGDVQNLAETLSVLPDTGRELFAAEIVKYFNSRLSYKAIADDLYNICTGLLKQPHSSALTLQPELQA